MVLPYMFGQYQKVMLGATFHPNSLLCMKLIDKRSVTIDRPLLDL